MEINADTRRTSRSGDCSGLGSVMSSILSPGPRYGWGAHATTGEGPIIGGPTGPHRVMTQRRRQDAGAGQSYLHRRPQRDGPLLLVAGDRGRPSAAGCSGHAEDAAAKNRRGVRPLARSPARPEGEASRVIACLVGEPGTGAAAGQALSRRLVS